MNYFDKIEKFTTSLDDYDQKENGKQEYEELIHNLKMKNQIVENALFTAQSLIDQYQKQNHELKEKNKFLTQHILYLQRQIEQERQLLQNSIDQKQYESKVNEKFKTLSIKQEKSQEKIKKLSRQLEKYKNERQQESKKKVQKQLGNYFSFPSETKSEKDYEQEIKKLKWRLKQRDEEVMLILKRSKTIQEKYSSLVGMCQQRGIHKEPEKFQTCSTQPTNIHRYNQ